MDLLVRVPTKYRSGFEVPDASEPQDPRPHQCSEHDANEEDNTLDMIHKVMIAIIADSYTRCPIQGLVI